MQAVVNSILTHYEASGKGRVVVLLHGWGDNLSTYKQLQADLSKQYTVVSLDLPGFGSTQAPATVWGLKDYAQFVNDFVNKLGHKNVYAVVGHSNGGTVAIYGLANGIIKADKLILLSAAGIRNVEKGKRLAIKIIAKTGKLVTFWLPASQKRKLQKKLYGAVGSDMLVAPHLQETFKRTVRQDVQADAAKLMVPTLLIYGSRDTATPPLYGEIYHNLINVSTLQIINAEHFVHHDQPEQVASAIKEFLA